MPALLALPFSSLALVGFLVLSIALAFIDFREKRLPNRLLLPAYPTLLLLLLAASWQENHLDALLRALAASVVLFGFYLVLKLVNSSGLGAGDVKLAALIGLTLGWLGWPQVFIATAMAFIGAAVVATIGLIARKLSLKSQIAFGPYMLAGCWLVIVPVLIDRL
jgi:leader peptidase (prepilin peptidase)/N-methyltransferase